MVFVGTALLWFLMVATFGLKLWLFTLPFFSVWNEFLGLVFWRKKTRCDTCIDHRRSLNDHFFLGLLSMDFIHGALIALFGGQL